MLSDCSPLGLRDLQGFLYETLFPHQHMSLEESWVFFCFWPAPVATEYFSLKTFGAQHKSHYRVNGFFGNWALSPPTLYVLVQMLMLHSNLNSFLNQAACDCYIVHHLVRFSLCCWVECRREVHGFLPPCFKHSGELIYGKLWFISFELRMLAFTTIRILLALKGLGVCGLNMDFAARSEATVYNFLYLPKLPEKQSISSQKYKTIYLALHALLQST